MLFLIPTAYGQGSSSLGTKCKPNGFSCGECETGLQDDLNKLMGKITNGGFTQGEHWGDGKVKKKSKNPGNISMAPEVTLEKTLEEIIGLFKKHNPGGDNKLNFVVIGESESLQASSVKNGKIYPRIMLKSPNSELMVTFNTDPEAKGYKTLEMMRWNGKQGRYEFQELNFGEKGKKPHVDASGTKCLECHKSPDPRPNWDTYRAWAGVVPSRDDMLEKHTKKGNGSPEFDKASDMQPDAKAYLNFLDQVANDKEAGKKSRIAMLDIPFDEKRQMADYVKAAAGKKFSPREQVDLIKKKINEVGYYRVKHFPDKDEAEDETKISFNLDSKTADWAGPSQFAFDQMLSQNMCKVATDLKRHKNFDKFKYPLALLIACGERNLDHVYSDEFKKKITSYYKDKNFSNLGDIDRNKIPKPGTEISFSELSNLIHEDTESSHDNANGYKFDRHGKFVKSFLTEVERMPAAEAAQKAKFYSEKVVTPTLDKFHAIGDEGGVKGVGEDSGDTISEARMLLEPFGVNVSHWSLVHGKNNASNSFSFSDQFSLLRSQPLWKEIKQQAGGSCSDLEKRAKESMVVEEPKEKNISPLTNNVSELTLICGSAESGISPLLDAQKIMGMGETILGPLKPDLKKSMGRCLGCHDTDGDVEFPGFKNFVNSDNETEFVDFLNSSSEYFNRPMIEVFQIKLGLIERPESDDGVDYGERMPPSDWKDNAEYASKHGIPESSVQLVRTRQLATYLTYSAAKGDKERLKSFCEKVNNDNYVKEFNKPGSTGENSSPAGKQ
jgi:hypothetical protein